MTDPAAPLPNECPRLYYRLQIGRIRNAYRGGWEFYWETVHGLLLPSKEPLETLALAVLRLPDVEGVRIEEVDEYGKPTRPFS